MTLFLLWPALRAEATLDMSARLVGSEFVEVEETLAQRFHSPFARPVLLVLSHVPSPARPEGRRILEEILSVLRTAPGVSGTFSYLDTSDPSLLGSTGTVVVVGLEAPGGRVEALVPTLRESLRSEQQRLDRQYPGAKLHLTGGPAINYDLWRETTLEARDAEVRSLPLTLVFLLAAFGSFFAAAVPVVVGVVAVVCVLGLVSFVSRYHPLSVLIVNLASMLGLALGIDYALLTLSRFREAREENKTCGEAAVDAVTHSGTTVRLSGEAVLVGFLALSLIPLNELRSCALGGLLVVFFSVLLSTTLVPGLIAMLGERIEAGRLFKGRTSMEVWRKWGRRVTKRPVLVLLVSLLPLLALASQAPRLSPRIPRGDWLPAKMDSALGLKALSTMGLGGLAQSLRIVLELPPETQVLSEEGWRAALRLEAILKSTPGVAQVHSLAALAKERASDLAAIALLPPKAKRTYLSEEGDAILLEAVPKEGVDPRELISLVRVLRRADVRAMTGLPGTRLRVGGLPAFDADYEGATAGRFPLLVGLVVLGTLLALFRSFRSVLIPLKAVALNLLSVTASFGALVLVFQDGWGSKFLGLKAPVDGVFPIVPPLVFCTVFGLSMDYEVFLVARVREARAETDDEGEALAEGLARTGGLITSAALVMVSVFLAFTLGEFIIVKMLGFTLAVAVLLDATLVRSCVGPALLRLAGSWNWWPGKISRPQEENLTPRSPKDC